MNRKLRIVREQGVIDRPAAVYEGVDRRVSLEGYVPDYYLSRIWMGVVPPEDGEAGYTCVLGEVYNPAQLAQREKPVILLDEAVALDPADFNKRERAYWDIRDDERQQPTKRRLGRAVVALKHLYYPHRILVPPSTDRRGQLIMDGARPEAPFTGFIRRLDGLMAYPEGYGHRWRQKWFPFYQTPCQPEEGVQEAYQEDRAYNRSLLDALFDAQLLTVLSHCTIYADEKLAASRRAVGLVLAEMEMRPAPQMRSPYRSDGYAEPVDDPEQEALSDAAQAQRKEMLDWFVGKA